MYVRGERKTGLNSPHERGIHWESTEVCDCCSPRGVRLADRCFLFAQARSPYGTRNQWVLVVGEYAHKFTVETSLHVRGIRRLASSIS